MDSEPLERIIDLALNFSLTSLLGLMVILFLLVYLIFAVIVVRQVGLLTRTLGTALSPWLKFVAWIHLGFSVLILMIALGFI